MRKIKFAYTDAKGKNTDRTAVVVAPASDTYLCIDVSEYDDVDKEFYMNEVEEAYKVFLQNVRDIGLASNWRKFKEVGITNLKEIE